jgi:hypothetical protein
MPQTAKDQEAKKEQDLSKYTQRDSSVVGRADTNVMRNFDDATSGFNNGGK